MSDAAVPMTPAKRAAVLSAYGEPLRVTPLARRRHGKELAPRLDPRRFILETMPGLRSRQRTCVFRGGH
jgi:hypothetical protein